MHKLMEYVCDQLDELERKADKEGKLSMSEIQYADTLAHLKKDLLTADAMMGDDYSNASYERDGYGGYVMARDRNRSRTRDGRYRSYRDDGYSRGDDLVDELRELMDKAPNEQTRKEIERLANKLEQM